VVVLWGRYKAVRQGLPLQQNRANKLIYWLFGTHWM
jgi:hypothetical protein